MDNPDPHRNREIDYQLAVGLVVTTGRASSSFVQRRLSCGYNWARSLVEQMESDGIVTPPNHIGKREVLVKSKTEEF